MLCPKNELLSFHFESSPLKGDEKKLAMKQLRERLSSLQLAVQQNGLPVIVLVEGWGTSGKGSRIASMIEALDPRFFRVISSGDATEEEKSRPFACRHLHNIPENGKFLFLDSGWMDETVRELQ